jgi:phage head maturation protease
VKTRTINLEVLSLRAAVSSIDAEKRTVDLIFSTGAAVTRYDYQQGIRYREVLSMDPKAVRLDRLNAAGQLLDSHSAYSVADVLGVVVDGSARVQKGQGLCTVRFSERPSIDEVWTDVRTGIIRSVSVGYSVYKFQEEKGKDGAMPTRTAIDWEPFEVSLVPMPADVGARVRSGDKSHSNECVIFTRDIEDADRARRLRFLQLSH